MKTDSLSARYEAVNQSHAERFSALEQAQVLVARFWETYEELEPWLGETETLITQLPPPAIDTEALRQQQDQMRVSGQYADKVHFAPLCLYDAFKSWWKDRICVERI